MYKKTLFYYLRLKNIFTLALLFVITYTASAQTDLSRAKKYVDEVSTEYLKSCLNTLASPIFEGRETAARGQKLAAAFIQYEFEDMGLMPKVPNEKCDDCDKSFQMPFFVYEENLLSATITSKTKTKNTWTAKKDFVAFIEQSTQGNEDLTFVFGGYGEKSVIEKMDIKGKAIVIYADKTNKNKPSERIEEIISKGARLIVVVNRNDGFESYHKRVSHYVHDTAMTLYKSENIHYLGKLYIPQSMGSKLFGKSEKYVKSILDKYEKTKTLSILKKIKPKTLRINFNKAIKKKKTENVLGYLEGNELKDELIVITAHYDHLGKRGDKIYYGADDNGSGTSTVLALAKAFTKAKQRGDGPKRSILFMTVSGEEKGLLGSEYYASNPIFPLKQTVANLNIDMIGRIDPQHKDSKDYVYLVGSDKLSDELHAISESINKNTLNLELDYTYNDEHDPLRIYYRSDHWNFAKNNIPVIFYFNGIHEDYHKVTDTPDKINYDLLKKRADLVYFTAWELANKSKRLKLNNK